eukprot:1649892-Rhodomonas_salina.1
MKNLLLSLSLLLLFSSSFAFVATDTGVTFRGIANAKILARRLRVSAQSATPQQETPSPADQDSGVTFRGIVNAKILARRLRLSAQTATTHRNGIVQTQPLPPSVSAAVRPTLYVLLTEGGDMLQTMCAAGEDSGKVFDEASVETLYLKQSGKTREQFLKVGSLLPPSLPFLATKTLTQHTISTSTRSRNSSKSREERLSSHPRYTPNASTLLLFRTTCTKNACRSLSSDYIACYTVATTCPVLSWSMQLPLRSAIRGPAELLVAVRGTEDCAELRTWGA